MFKIRMGSLGVPLLSFLVLGSACVRKSELNNQEISTSPVDLTPVNPNPQTPVTVGTLRISHQGVNFGVAVTGATSNVVITLQNVGSGEITFGSVSSLTPPFFAPSSNCGSKLTASATCTIGVEFRPSSNDQGLKSAVFSFQWNDGKGAQSANIPLQGAAARPAMLAVNTSTAAFGRVPTGSSPRNITLTFSNSGDVVAPLRAAVNVSAPFSFVDDQCSGAILPGTDCSVTLRLTPNQVGEFNPQIRFPYFNGASEQSGPTVATTASVEAPATFVVSPISFDFGETLQGAVRTATFRLSNTTPGIGTVGIIPALSAPFSIVSNQCGNSLAGSAFCDITVEFRPTDQRGAQSATLRIPWNNRFEDKLIEVSIAGFVKKAATLTPSLASFSFGQVPTGSTNKTVTVTYRNDGDVGAQIRNITGVSSPLSVSSQNCPAVVPVNQTCNVVYQLAPSQAGAVNQTVRYPFHDGNQEQPGTALALSAVVRTYLKAAASGKNEEPRVRVWNNATGALLFNDVVYAASFRGGVRIAVGDVNRDYVDDFIVAPGPGRSALVKVYNGRDNSLIRTFEAYANWNGGVFVAAGDVDADGYDDIVTGADAGAGPDTRIYAGNDNHLIRQFMAYATAFHGGVRVASADYNNDGKADIITGAGAGGGPHVMVFNGADNSVLASFFAYASTFSGGVFVGAGDLNLDGKADIVTGAGSGAGPHVIAFDAASQTQLASFFAYESNFPGGVAVAVGDINLDGRNDLISGKGFGDEPHMIGFSGLDYSIVFNAFPLPTSFTGGIFVAATKAK